MEPMHYHKPGTPRLWACGFVNGAATSRPELVTCEECLKTLPKEEAHGHEEALPVPQAKLPGQG